MTSMPGQFAAPKTDEEISEARVQAVPKKTREDTEYCIRIWESWRSNRISHGYIVPSILQMSPQTMSQWMSKFVVEARKVNGCEYQPNTLYHIVCGIMRRVRMNMPKINFLKIQSLLIYVEL